MRREKEFFILLLCLAVFFISSCDRTPREEPVQSLPPLTLEETVPSPEERVREIPRKENVPIEFFGAVTDENGAPIEFAQVTAAVAVQNQTQPQHEELQEIREWTDPQGRFRFADIEGSRLTIQDISKEGYEELQILGNPETDFYYSGFGRKLHLPEEGKPVTFFLAERIEPAFLIEIGGESNWGVVVERKTSETQTGILGEKDDPVSWFRGTGTVRHDFVRKRKEAVAERETGSDAMQTWDLEMTASFDVRRRGCSLTMSSPGPESGVIVSGDRLRRAPEAGYSQKVVYQPREGRSVFYIYVKSREPSIYSVVEIKAEATQEDCELSYAVSVNPYGETGFERMAGTREEFQRLEEEAVSALTRGELPGKP